MLKMSLNHKICLCFTLVLGLGGCGTYQGYQISHGPYDRETVCDTLSRQLKYYDNPSYASKHPISQEKLDEMINVYHANGCDK